MWSMAFNVSRSQTIYPGISLTTSGICEHSSKVVVLRQNRYTNQRDVIVAHRDKVNLMTLVTPDSDKWCATVRFCLPTPNSFFFQLWTEATRTGRTGESAAPLVAAEWGVAHEPAPVPLQHTAERTATNWVRQAKRKPATKNRAVSFSQSIKFGT